MVFISPAALEAQRVTDTAHKHLTTLVTSDPRVRGEFTDFYAVSAARIATANSEPPPNLVQYSRTLISPVQVEAGIATALLYVTPSEKGIETSARVVAENILGDMKRLGVVFENEATFVKKCAGAIEHSINCSTVKHGDFYRGLKLPRDFSLSQFQSALRAQFKTPDELSSKLAELVQQESNPYGSPISRGIQDGIDYSVLPQNQQVAQLAARSIGKDLLVPCGLPDFFSHTARIVFEGPDQNTAFSRDGNRFSHLPQNWLSVVKLCCVDLPQFYAFNSMLGRTSPQEQDLLKRTPKLMEQLTTPDFAHTKEVISDIVKLVELISRRCKNLPDVSAALPAWMSKEQTAAMRQAIDGDISLSRRIIEILTDFSSKGPHL